MNDLQPFISQIEQLIQNLSPIERRAMLRNLSTELRRRNAQRIKANIEPDGSAMASRSGDRWKMRGLRDGQTLKIGQRFNHFKDRDLVLAFVRDDGNKIVGRETSFGGSEMRGFLRQNIYFKGATGKRIKMFQKMAQTKYLRRQNTADQAVIGFLSGISAKIAAEHHEGSPKKNLPARELIGLPPEDLQFAQQQILAAISQGLK